MPKERSKSLLDKSIAAAIAAIEIYNKPDFRYREETFTILMINAWELLAKGKILADNKNKMQSIFVPQRTADKRGKPLKRFYPKRNRAGNPMTIELIGALKQIGVPNVLMENIQILVEVRDNAIHYLNNDRTFGKKFLEVGTANLKSYVTMVREWFQKDMSEFNFFLLPISFYHPYEWESFSVSSGSEQIKRLVSYIQSVESRYPTTDETGHSISLKLVTKFEKSNDLGALKVKFDENATMKVDVNAEDVFSKKYPMDYDDLIKKLLERYSDFVRNPKFYALKKEAEADKKYSDIRYLNVKKKKSQMRYYSTEILKYFDPHYTKKA